MCIEILQATSPTSQQKNQTLPGNANNCIWFHSLSPTYLLVVEMSNMVRRLGRQSFWGWVSHGAKVFPQPEKKREWNNRFKLIALNVASKHKLIFYTSIPIQNAQNHFSKSKTLQVMSNIGFEIEKEHILPRPLRIQRTWTLTCPSWPAACCGGGPAVWVVLNLFWNRSGACLPIQQKLWKRIRLTGQRVSFFS